MGIKINKTAIFYIYGILGVICLMLFVYQIASFCYPQWYFQNHPNVDKFVGINIVSRWAYFSFFTYHTMIIFAIWSILLMISQLRKSKKLREFLLKPSVVGFVVSCYIITTTIYTIFELCTGSNFGFCTDTVNSYINFVADIFIHYVVFIFVIGLLFLVKPTPKDTKNRHLVYIYLVFYMILTKITGQFCYIIEWYPYLVFDTTSMLAFLGLNGNSIWLNMLLSLFIACAFLILFMLLYKLIRIILVSKTLKKRYLICNFE